MVPVACSTCVAGGKTGHTLFIKGKSYSCWVLSVLQVVSDLDDLLKQWLEVVASPTFEEMLS